LDILCAFFASFCALCGPFPFLLGKAGY
jgi:hypothetical protein